MESKLKSRSLKEAVFMEKFTEQMARQIIKPRPSISHKGDFGRVLIIAGDEHFGGAAIMSATAAVYAGAGLVTVATVRDNWQPLHARLPEAMVTDWDAATLTPLLHGADVVVIGPGIGTSSAAQQVLTLCLQEIAATQTLIIDGSAIDIIAQNKQLPAKGNIIWTPHQMEWQRLSGIAIAEQTLTTTASANQRIGGTLVLKGNPTRIYNADAGYENTTGGPAMATGGSGDTLTGVIAAICAQFGNSTKAIATAVWLHSAAADEIAKSSYVALPTQVVQVLPQLLNRLAAATAAHTIGF
jgi:hydroxyethylthiazole kinase-like uncharacterized protein yjeF